MSNHDFDLEDYFQHVRIAGKLPSETHARRWSSGVLKTLGTSLNGSTKRSLAKALPDQLANDLKGVFWLLHFRDPHMSRLSFQNRVARRSGNSDPEFAIHPIRAVFAALKGLIDRQLSERVGNALSPDLQHIWQDADLASNGN